MITRSKAGTSPRALHHKPSQRQLQVGARGAAQAAVAEQGDFVGRPAHQRVVDADGAEFVDDDGGVAALGRGQEASNQRGLAGSQKSSDDRHRNARAARTFLPATEGAGFV